MFLIDEENRIIHDMSFVKYECHIDKIPKDKRRKVYTLDQVKRMCDSQAQPRYMGCKYCLSEYYEIDLTSLFH
jgi:hypothetical protein